MDILTAKIKYGFDQLAQRNQGILDRPEHVAMGRRTAASLGYVVGSAGEARMIDAYLKIWEGMHLVRLRAGAHELTKEEFVRSTLAIADDPVTRDATLGALAQTFFELADADRDGMISADEFRGFQHGHFPELSPADIDAAFAHLDTDGDGHLSREQFTGGMVEYWTSRDPDAPGNWWLGRPVYERTALRPG